MNTDETDELSHREAPGVPILQRPLSLTFSTFYCIGTVLSEFVCPRASHWLNYWPQPYRPCPISTAIRHRTTTEAVATLASPPTILTPSAVALGRMEVSLHLVSNTR